jgi:death-on-curing protein
MTPPSPRFLTTRQVLRLHARQIAKYGGSPGVRDIGLLESALAQPKQSFGGQYVHEDLPAMAAAYVYHVVKNHPFVDGNKRTGAYAGLFFLEVNGLSLTPVPQEFGDLVLAVAEGSATKEQVAAFFRDRIG